MISVIEFRKVLLVMPNPVPNTIRLGIYSSTFPAIEDQSLWPTLQLDHGSCYFYYSSKFLITGDKFISLNQQAR